MAELRVWKQPQTMQCLQAKIHVHLYSSNSGIYSRHHCFQGTFSRTGYFCLLHRVKLLASAHRKLTNKYHSLPAMLGWSIKGSMHKHRFKMFVSVPEIHLTSCSLIWERVMFHSLQRKNWDVDPQTGKNNENSTKSKASHGRPTQAQFLLVSTFDNSC